MGRWNFFGGTPDTDRYNNQRLQSKSHCLQFVIVFTDGRLFVEDKIVPPIKSLVAEGANIIVLGVGNQAEDVLLQVADGKKVGLMDRVKDYRTRILFLSKILLIL